MNRQAITAGILCATLLFSCSDDEEEEDSPGIISTASFSTFTAGKATVSFTEDQAGQQYLLLPFHTGTLDTVNGATSAKSDFTISGTGASLRISEIARPVSLSLSVSQLETNLTSLLRTIMNRFQAQKEAKNQQEDLWNLVSQAGKLMKKIPSRGDSAALKFRQDMNHRLQILRKREQLIRTKKPLGLSEEGCNFAGAGTDISDTISFTSDATTANKTIHEQVDGGSYCLVFLEGSGYALTNKATLESTIKKSLNLLKNVIYKGESFGDKTMDFLPQFVFTDPKLIGVPGIMGAHILSATKEAGVPILVMAYDLQAIGKDESDASVGELHATIIHELQHAVHYFYRSDEDKLDSKYIDEGLAHMVEDLAGYSDNNNFSNYAFSFLLTRSSGESPFFNDSLNDSDSDVDTKGRGAGHTFFYYLASQKGGFEFTDGVISGGLGLDFLASVTKSGKFGMKNVHDLYTTESLNWEKTTGNYLAALMLDNNSLIHSVGEAHKVFAPRTDITDLQGNTNKGFGMHFNSFKDLDNATDEANLTKASDTTISLHFYQTKPLLVNTGSGASSVSIETAADNSGLAVVRLK